MTEQGGGLGELVQQVQLLVRGLAVVHLHLVCQTSGFIAALKLGKMKKIGTFLSYFKARILIKYLYIPDFFRM